MISGRYPNLGPRSSSTQGSWWSTGRCRRLRRRRRRALGPRARRGRLRRRGAARVGPCRRRRGDRRGARPGAQRPGHPAGDLHPQQHRVPATRAGPPCCIGVGLPRLNTRIAGRSVVVVVRGHQFERELELIRSFVREQEPVVVGVGGAADVPAPPACGPTSWSSTRVLRTPGPTSAKIPHGRPGRRGTDRAGGSRRRSNSSGNSASARRRSSPAATPGTPPCPRRTPASPQSSSGSACTRPSRSSLDRQRPGPPAPHLGPGSRSGRNHRRGRRPLAAPAGCGRGTWFLVMLAGLVALAAAIAVTPLAREGPDQPVRLALRHRPRTLL